MTATPPASCSSATSPADALVADGRALAAAGASMLVTQAVKIPVIGIGAGPHCSGQVLVVYDALGVTARKPSGNCLETALKLRED